LVKKKKLISTLSSCVQANKLRALLLWDKWKHTKYI